MRFGRDRRHHRGLDVAAAGGLDDRRAASRFVAGRRELRSKYQRARRRARRRGLARGSDASAPAVTARDHELARRATRVARMPRRAHARGRRASRGSARCRRSANSDVPGASSRRACARRSSARIWPTSPKPISATRGGRSCSAAPDARGHEHRRLASACARCAAAPTRCTSNRAGLVRHVHLDGEESGRMLDVEPLRAVGSRERRPRAAATEPGSTQARRDADRAEHADRLVHAVRDEGARADRAAVPRRGDTRHIFGTVFFATSPRFIRGPSASRIASMRAFSAASASSSSGVSSPVMPRSAARGSRPPACRCRCR